MKAEMLVEVGDDVSEQTGDGQWLPATAGGWKRKAVLATGQACDSGAGFAVSLNEQVRTPGLDGEVAAAALVQLAEQFLCVCRGRLLRRGVS